MPRVFIFFWLCGGFVFAFFCFIFATLLRHLPKLKWVCLFGGFCGLLYEAGCSSAMAQFGAATGGVSDPTFGNYVTGGIFVGILWAFLLILYGTRPGK